MAAPKESLLLDATSAKALELAAELIKPGQLFLFCGLEGAQEVCSRIGINAHEIFNKS